VDEAFGVDSKRYYSWKKQLEETGSLEYRLLKERNGKINKNELARLLEEHPDWYLREFAEKCNVCLQAIDKMFKKLGVTRKKNVYLFGKTGKRTGGVSEPDRRNTRKETGIGGWMQHKRVSSA
jgi:transposase